MYTYTISARSAVRRKKKQNVEINMRQVDRLTQITRQSNNASEILYIYFIIDFFLS